MVLGVSWTNSSGNIWLLLQINLSRKSEDPLALPSFSPAGRRDGGSRGGRQRRGDGGGGRLLGPGGLDPGPELRELPALRAAGVGPQPELAADRLLRHERLRLQSPPGDAAQTPGGTDAAGRAAPSGLRPGRRPRGGPGSWPAPRGGPQPTLTNPEHRDGLLRHPPETRGPVSRADHRLLLPLGGRSLHDGADSLCQRAE